MCGVNGFFVNNKIEGRALGSTLKKMNKAIAHRGPDDEGLVFFNENNALPLFTEDTHAESIQNTFPYAPFKSLKDVDLDIYHGGFAHRRLSIIDLSALGHQPMCSANKNLWITFNGELYNYLELREKLKQLGCSFFSDSDTEVVLKSFEYWGENCLQHFNGMFAFAIYNINEKKIFAARDRLGVKPFYYSIREGVFAFSSEVKGLLKSFETPPSLNEKAVFEYFVNDKIEQKTPQFFKQVSELEAGHAFWFNLKDFTLKSFRYFRGEPNEMHESETQILSRLEELLHQSVKQRLRADVPVGVCLSGGVDSSIIATKVKDILPNNELNFYTAAYHNPEFDESKYAGILVDNERINWHKVYPESKSLLSNLETFIHALDLPIWSTSTFAQFCVMQKVKGTGIKVVLSGQGGDELFGGYPHYIPSFVQEQLGFGFNNTFGLNKDYFKQFAKAKARRQIEKWLPNKKLAALYQKKNPEITLLNHDFFNHFAGEFQSSLKYFSTLNEHLAYDLDNEVLKRYLRCEDRCSMYFSVESRTPFSDDFALINYALSIPSELKIKDGYSKYILRKAFEGKIPESVLWRKDKMGYVTPNRKWISEIASEVYPYFEQSGLSAYFDKNKLETDLLKLLNNKNATDNPRVFKLVAFAVWFKLFVAD
jgi:asparagine synthase (glutamine-hydrolysing)